MTWTDYIDQNIIYPVAQKVVQPFAGHNFQTTIVEDALNTTVFQQVVNYLWIFKAIRQKM